MEQRAPCPCCGGFLPAGAVARESLFGLLISMGSNAMFAKIVRRLARRPGQAVLIRELVESIYHDDPLGGPDYAESYLRKLISIHRNDLAVLGWRLRSKSWNGYWIEAVGEAAQLSSLRA